MKFNNFAQRMENLSGESAYQVLSKARFLESQGKHIVHMEIGEPDFETPENIIRAGKDALDNGFTHYTEAQGYYPFRQTIADYAMKYKNIKTCPEEIIATPGGKPVMFYAILSLVNPGDEVIYPDPGFPIYRSLIRLAGGIPVPISLREENDFRIDMKELESKLTNRTKLLIINSPGNPTGGVLTPDDIDSIAELLRETDTFVLSDEIYDRIIYEGNTKSIASIPHMKDRTIVLDGFSKAYAMTGWRLGYGIMSKKLASEVLNFIVNTNSCCAAFTQVAGIEALSGPQNSVDLMKESFKERRDVIVNGLNQIKGISCNRSKGAFYVFPNITALNKSSNEMADYLLNSGGVACLSGSSFGATGEGHLRFSYATSLTNINEALDRIEHAVSKL